MRWSPGGSANAYPKMNGKDSSTPASAAPVSTSSIPFQHEAAPPVYTEFSSPMAYSPAVQRPAGSPISYVPGGSTTSPHPGAFSSPVYIPSGVGSGDQIVSLKDESRRVVCPRCAMAVKTRTKKKMGGNTAACSLCLLPSYLCCCPLLCCCARDVEHYCPACGHLIYRYRSDM